MKRFQLLTTCGGYFILLLAALTLNSCKKDVTAIDLQDTRQENVTDDFQLRLENILVKDADMKHILQSSYAEQFMQTAIRLKEALSSNRLTYQRALLLYRSGKMPEGAPPQEWRKVTAGIGLIEVDGKELERHFPKLQGDAYRQQFIMLVRNMLKYPDKFQKVLTGPLKLNDIAVMIVTPGGGDPGDMPPEIDPCAADGGFWDRYYQRCDYPNDGWGANEGGSGGGSGSSGGGGSGYGGVTGNQPSAYVRAAVISAGMQAISEIDDLYYFDLPLSAAERAQLVEYIYPMYPGDFESQVTIMEQYGGGGYIGDEDPTGFVEWFRQRMRKYLGIDAPESAQEATQIEQEIAGFGSIAQKLRDLRTGISLALGWIPGFAALDAYLMRDYGSGTANLTMDLFGASLLRYAKTGLTIGAKHLIKIFQLKSVYPNIGSYLSSIGIREITIFKRNSDKVLIIGERMSDRVNPSRSLFQKIFPSEIETFSPSAAAENELSSFGRTLSDAELKSTLMYQENLDWIKRKIAEGYSVIDIGSQTPGQIKSVFYEMERSVVYPR